jgi:pyruvate/2-oxoacid:ferredoxin oxidoreductase alpha subunit
VTELKQFKKFANKYPGHADPVEVIQETLNALASSLGKKYKLFEYYGSPTAKTVLVSFGARTWLYLLLITKICFSRLYSV